MLNKLIDVKKNNEEISGSSESIKWGRDLLDTNKIHMEDGFIRSKGLGVHLYYPVSWVFDRRGIYYDPRCISDLEEIINNRDLSKEMLTRANNVLDLVFRNDVTKYNLQSKTEEFQKVKNSQLVIGQVEDDKSIILGATSIRTNIDLIKKARELNPSKKIFYKPHPDYATGLRRIDSTNQEVAKYCDGIINKNSITDCFKMFDEFVVNTSLAGFEALIRGKKVTCFGEPFYAGWGLTKDMSKKYIHRRKRKLTIQELAYSVLIEYPTYFNLSETREIEIEEAIEHIKKQKPNSRVYNYFAELFLHLRNKLK